MREDFCVFILTHGRPDKVVTYNTLLRQGYTGKIFLVIDDEDKTADEYQHVYGRDNVLIFSKDEIAKSFDLADSRKEKRAAVYARNACFGLAEGVGCKYFVQLDDDYTVFNYKFTSDIVYTETPAGNLDSLFSSLLDFLEESGALSVAIAQGGDFIGGEGATDKLYLKRKAMNSWFCTTDRPFNFTGTMNDDVNTYVGLGHKGHLFFTVISLEIKQPATQSAAGGMTDIYKDMGTYMKSFYTVMIAPSCCVVAPLAKGFCDRLHHRISWDHCVSKIISENHRKAEA